MTVKELIEKLRECRDQDAEVVITPVIWRVPVSTVDDDEDGKVELS